MDDFLAGIYHAIVGAVREDSRAQVALFVLFALLIGGAIYFWDASG